MEHQQQQQHQEMATGAEIKNDPGYVLLTSHQPPCYRVLCEWNQRVTQRSEWKKEKLQITYVIATLIRFPLYSLHNRSASALRRALN
jgi:hypothetical protein